MYNWTWLGIVLVFGTVIAMPTDKGDKTDMTQATAMAYLNKYHYMGADSPIAEIAAMPEEEGYSNGLRMFQSMNGLEVTGELDEPTMKLMAMPRCGVPDVTAESYMKRKKRYSARGGKWPKTSLTYKITVYTPDMSKEDVDFEIKRAFSVWEMVTPLRFTKVAIDQPADIVILFGAYSHGDPYPFDGRSGTLAHAFYPLYGGDAHFDESEPWTLNTYNGVNLFQVAAHEFGHSLGLGHSSINTALMAPFYGGYQPDFQLDQDDIDGIQSIYGPPVNNPETTTTTTQKTTTRQSEKPTTTTTPATTTTMQPDLADLCNHATFDAITKHETSDGVVRTFVFRNDYYAELDDNGILPGYPRPISGDWQGLPGNLDAALFWEAKYKTFWVYDYDKQEWTMTKQMIAPARTYFFKGNEYWRFRAGQMDSGYPQKIDEVWGLPANLDAAFVWSGNGNIYFLKDKQYYRYNSEQWRVDQGYPRTIESWSKHFSTGVDAAYKHGNSTYFFVDGNYYLYDDSVFEVAPGFPKETSKDILGCDRLQSQIQGDQSGQTNGVSGTVLGVSALVNTLLMAVLCILMH